MSIEDQNRYKNIEKNVKNWSQIGNLISDRSMDCHGCQQISSMATIASRGRNPPLEVSIATSKAILNLAPLGR